MKVLLINGSPHERGCTFSALAEVAGALEKHSIQTEIFWIGNHAVQGCIACGKCRMPESSGCIFKDHVYTSLRDQAELCDGLVVGSPVYYAGPTGALCAILDRLFFSAAKYLTHKPGACVVNCRRGGASAAFDRLNKYFTINQMPVVSSQYWNATHGMTPEEMKRDPEGLQIMRTLGENMAYLLQSQKKAALPFPAQEVRVSTNFIS